MKLRFYKVGPSWVISCRFKRAGLIHWSGHSFWNTLATFPRAFYYHMKLAHGWKANAKD